VEGERGGGEGKGDKREVGQKEEKVAEPEQAIDKQERALYQRGSKLEQCSKRVEEEMETHSAQLAGLNICPLRHLV
jgi:hypothetical protein